MHQAKVCYTAGAYLGFSNTKGYFYPPPRWEASPSQVYFALLPMAIYTPGWGEAL